MAATGASMDLTMASVPISKALMDATGLSLALTLKPFLFPRKGISNELPHADDIGRCRACNAYQNIYSPFDERGYVCTLCYTENTFDQRRNGRYLGQQTRETLPELQGDVYDVSLDDPSYEIVLEDQRDQEEQNGGSAGIREDQEDGNKARPGRTGIPVDNVYFAVVDVCGRAEDVEEFRSALLTVLDALPESQYFALALLDESSLYVMNWKANRFHTVRCTEENALRTMADRIALHEIFGRVKTVKQSAELLISQLEPKPAKAGEEHLHSCYYGEAIKGLLGFLVKAKRDLVDHVDVDGRMVGSRIATFLSKVPSKGSGAVLSPEERQREQQTGYYQDPLNPEFAMANLSIDDRGQATDRRLEGSAAQESTNGERSPAYTHSGALDQISHEFYSGAGAAAAVIGLSLDMYFVGEGHGTVGAESLAVMTTLSGGDFIVYDNDSVTLAEDLHDMVHRQEMLDCSIKIRTSAELQILGNMDSRIHEDADQSDLYHAPRLFSDATCGCIIMEICDTGLGLSNRPPVYVQAAVRYHCIEDGFLRTYLRVVTCEFPVATTIGKVLSNQNAPLSLFIEFIGAMTVVGMQGRDEAAAVLDDRVEAYLAKRRAYIENGDYVGDQGDNLGPDIFGFGMHRLIAILDGGGAPGEYNRLEQLYYGRRRSIQELLQVLMGSTEHADSVAP